MPKLALLDGHSLAYRAFYALPSDLATPAGQVTNAVFGFTSMLIKLLGEEEPDAVAVAWDVRGPTFRKERYPEYKAQREAPPDLFRSQLPLMDEVLDVLRISQLRVQGVEADDVIATLATQASSEGWDVVVVTGDRDAFQLIGPSVRVLYTLRGISDTVDATVDWLKDRYGVTPEKYTEYAALRGDSSDNLPGVPGVGEKTAAKLLANYGSLEGIFEHVDEQTPKLRENLSASKDQVFLNRELMVLVRDVAFEGVADGKVSLDAFMMQAWEHDDVRKVFDGLAFRVLWERLLELGGQAAESAEMVEVSVTSQLSKKGIGQLATARSLVLEPVWFAGDLTGVIVVDPDGEANDAAFVPLGGIDGLAPALADPSLPKAVHEAKPLLRSLFEAEIPFEGLVFDTALAAYLINPAQRAPDLQELAYRELGVTVELSGGEDADATPQATFDFEAGPGPDLDAAGRRAVVVRDLVSVLGEQIESRGGTALFEEIELPLVPILARMELAGIKTDRAFLEELGDDLRGRLADLEASIHEAAGEVFNVNSTLQLREVLFDRLELPILKKTPKGVPSTDATVLAKLRDEHPVVANLLEYRELEKLRSTYVDALLPLIDDDGRVRGRFNQMAAATGRLSQEQPNLQNIPVRSEEGRIIRKAFVSEEGHTFLVADYSQIELRILAHLSSDAGLLGAFEQDQDIHQATAARVNNVNPDEVTPDMRRRAKMINFGLLYGMEAYGLAQRLKIEQEEAQEHIDAYFAQFPDVRAFMKGVVAEARNKGYTSTLLGRRRYLPELASSNFRDRQTGERMALNAPIQGAAADIIKKAMVELSTALQEGGFAAEMLLQIHDELVLEVPDEELDAVTDLTTRVMEGIVELDVPLKVDVAIGRNLAECKS